MFLIGANNTLNAFASTLYPTVIRSTGVSWGSSFGRLAGSVGPYFGGVLAGRSAAGHDIPDFCDSGADWLVAVFWDACARFRMPRTKLEYS